MHNAREFNFDGLVGPSHNYAGLSFGNVASFSNVRSASNPLDGYTPTGCSGGIVAR